MAAVTMIAVGSVRARKKAALTRYAAPKSKIACKSGLLAFSFFTGGGLFASDLFGGLGRFLGRLLRAFFAGLLCRRRTLAAGEDVVPVVGILLCGSHANDTHCYDLLLILWR